MYKKDIALKMMKVVLIKCYNSKNKCIENLKCYLF